MLHEKADIEKGNAAADPSSLEGQPLEQHTTYKEPSVSNRRLTILILCISICLFLSFLDTSIVATALYSIGEDFGSLSSINWVALSYTLAYVGCSVIVASLGDVFGRRNVYIACGVSFLAFSLGCGFAQSLTQLIVLRAFQGIAGSGLYSLAIVIFPEICPTDMFKWIAGVIGAVVAVSGVCGPVFGGLITNYTTWRWIFWINAPVGILAVAGFAAAWPKPDEIRPVVQRPFRQMDFVGAVLLCGASCLVVLAFQEGGSGDGQWDKPIFIASLVVGCVCWILLFGWQAVVERHWPNSISSIFPMRMIKNRIYFSNVVVTILAGFPYFIAIYNIPIHLQIVNGKSPLIAGVSLLPMLAGASIGSVLGGLFTAKKNNSCAALVAGSCLTVIGTAALTTLSDSATVPPRLYGLQVFIGLGFGVSVSTVSILCSLESEMRDNAVAQGIVSQFRIFGGSIGIAASSSILGVNQRKDLAGIVSQSQLETLAQSARNLSPAQFAAVRRAYSDAFTEIMKVGAIVAGVGVVVALGTMSERYDILQRRKEMFDREMERQRQLAEKTSRN